MKLFLVITLLILSTLLYEAQGINRKLMTETISTSTTTSASTITYKKHNNEENKGHDLKLGNKSTEDNLAVNLSSKHLKYGKTEANPPGYADIVDLAGMDYSPARRKPPIHN
ncbi:uncharacterized protein LOC111908361 [Lactuca sativa]|uniref:Uncharacterized protein n=1 Tax=Lactuca sativa TaxID=4236 RepID=A0A9R1US02_LACSA|nr:uncharacterized protein LOC111908361 [Lactuca sativa]KAJ0191805.1 hypothetical protein LSAT_V11C800413920 [Lactuca sativa]